MIDIAARPLRKFDGEAFPKNIGEVNSFLKSKGVKQTLVKGQGYYYFMGPDTVEKWHEASVYTYRISDMRFKSWYAAWEGLAHNSRNHDTASASFVMPFSELIMDGRSVSLALKDVIANKLSHNSEKPIITWVGNEGLHLGDGYHRVIEAILKGKKSLRAIKGNRFATEFAGNNTWKPTKSKTFGFEVLGFSENDIKRAKSMINVDTASTLETKPEYNFKKTGGAFGKVRLLPGYTIYRNPVNDRFIVKDDKTKQTVGAGYKTVEDAVKDNVFRVPHLRDKATDMTTRTDIAAKEIILWGLPKGKTDRLYEKVLYTKAKTKEDVEKVKIMAAKDGWHGFRVTNLDLDEKPQFGKNLLRKDKAAETSLVKTLKSDISPSRKAIIRKEMFRAAKIARNRGFTEDFDLSGLRTLWTVALVHNRGLGSLLKGSAIDKCLKELLPELNKIKADKDTAGQINLAAFGNTGNILIDIQNGNTVLSRYKGFIKSDISYSLDMGDGTESREYSAQGIKLVALGLFEADNAAVNDDSWTDEADAKFDWDADLKTRTRIGEGAAAPAWQKGLYHHTKNLYRFGLTAHNIAKNKANVVNLIIAEFYAKEKRRVEPSQISQITFIKTKDKKLYAVFTVKDIDTAASINGKVYDDLEKAIRHAIQVLIKAGKIQNKNAFNFTMGDMWQLLNMINTDMQEEHHEPRRNRPRVAEYAGFNDGMLTGKFYNEMGLNDTHIKTALAKVMKAINTNTDEAHMIDEAAGNTSTADHYRGVAKWVSEYQVARKAGNVKLAKQIRNNIKAAIAKHDLDATRVWGSDPDSKNVDEAASIQLDLTESDASQIKDQLKAPYTNARVSTLGGKGRYSIGFNFSLESKDKWKNGIFENSRGAKFMLNHDGSLEHISGNLAKYPEKHVMRKSKVKSVADAIAKVNKFISEAPKLDTANKDVAMQNVTADFEDIARTGGVTAPVSGATKFWAAKELLESFRDYLEPDMDKAYVVLTDVDGETHHTMTSLDKAAVMVHVAKQKAMGRKFAVKHMHVADLSSQFSKDDVAAMMTDTASKLSSKDKMLTFAQKYPGWHSCAKDSVKYMNQLEKEGKLEVKKYNKKGVLDQFRLKEAA